MPAFSLYLRAVLGQWFIFMSAGPLIVDEFIRWIHPQAKTWLDRKISRELRRKVEIAIMLAVVFFSGFQVFNDEHVARLDAESRARGKSPSALQSQVDELTTELKTERETKSQTEWEPLTDAEIEEWIRVLTKYRVDSMAVYWEHINGTQFYLSVIKVARGLHCKVSSGSGSADAGTIDVLADKRNPAGLAVLGLLKGRPASITFFDEKVQNPKGPSFDIGIFLGEKL